MSLLELRKLLGLSQFEIAKELGVSINTYINWERGVMNPNEENQHKIDKLIIERVK